MPSTPDTLEAAAAHGRVISWFAATAPERLAVVSDRRTLTYAELDGRVNQLVHHLRAQGLTTDDAIALV